MRFWTFATTSKALSILAFAAWIASMFLPALRNAHDAPLGSEFLMLGWLGLIYFYPCWLANPLFLYAGIRAISGKPAPMSALGAAVLALSSIALGVVPNPSIGGGGGNFREAIAVGWGAILWACACCLMLAAQGTLTKKIGNDQGARGDSQFPFRQFGLALALGILGISTFYAIRDRSGAAASELQRLAGMAFKRGEVCRQDPPMSSVLAKKVSGAIEFRDVKGFRSLESPFQYVPTMLDMGVEAYRIWGRDFKYEKLGSERMMVSIPPTGEPSAILSAWDDGFDNNRSSHVQLIEFATQQAIFSHSSKIESVGYNYCPDFPPARVGKEGPFAFLVNSVNLIPAMTSEKSAQSKTFWDLSQKSSGHIQTEKVDSDFVGERDLIRQLKQGPAGLELNSAVRNRNCPSNVGWTRDVKYGPFRPFVIDHKAFHPRELGNRDRAYCQAGYVYVYSNHLSSDGHMYISIEKRSIDTFAVVSRDTIAMEAKGKWSDADQFHLLAVKGEGKIVAISLGRESNGSVLEVLVTPK